MTSTRLYRLKRRLNLAAQARGYQLKVPITRLDREFDLEAVAAIRAVAPYTMTPPSRIVVLRDAIGYILDAKIPGTIVECGVWRGGSMMAAANELLRLGVVDRDLWLYDTFTGMTEPTAEDQTVEGRDGRVWFEDSQASPEPNSSGVDGVPLRVVRSNVMSTGYPADRVRFVEGPVEDTLETERPEGIALLRLDTDFYASTKAELEHLFPLLAHGGILMLDDYGFWRGAKLAVDEYFEGRPHLLHRIDGSARMLIKQ